MEMTSGSMASYSRAMLGRSSVYVRCAFSGDSPFCVFLEVGYQARRGNELFSLSQQSDIYSPFLQYSELYFSELYEID